MALLLKSLFFASLLFVSGSSIPSFLDDVSNNARGVVKEGADFVNQDVDEIVNGKGINVDDTTAIAIASKLFPNFPDPDNSNEIPVLEGNDAETKSIGEEKPFPNDAEENRGFVKPNFKTNYLGVWKIDNPNSGVSSMQIQLLPNNKVIMYDATNLGSGIQLEPIGTCRPMPNKPGQVDCLAHAIEYDAETAKIRTLKVLTNSWCSSGGLAADGTLISTGGFEDGEIAVRLLNACENCDWQENPVGLVGRRWYATQEKLEDGSFILFGGRREYSYEYVQNSLEFPKKRVDLPFLLDTSDRYENNLYPFSYLLPDGTVFLFANSRSIIIDPKTDKIVRELPVLPGGSRNYPASGMSALLPLKIYTDSGPVEAEVLVCGGAKKEAAEAAEARKEFMPALQDCARLIVTKPGAQWTFDKMPTRRVMGDMLLLPTGDVLIVNGAMNGVSGWGTAELPNMTPLLYRPKKKLGKRFRSLKATQIPRMYHASAAVLADGKVLVAGSNTNPVYDYKAKYPTELRVEKFSPPYLDRALDKHRPQISEGNSDKKLAYGEPFNVEIQLEDDGVGPEDLKLTMLAPPFTTHGYSQNQRLLVLEPVRYVNGQITAVAPPSGKLAPPGYYLLYVVHRGVPSRGMWVQIQ